MSGHKSTIKASKYLEKAYLLLHRVGTELGRMGKIIDEAELEEFRGNDSYDSFYDILREAIQNTAGIYEENDETFIDSGVNLNEFADELLNMLRDQYNIVFCIGKEQP